MGIHVIEFGADGRVEAMHNDKMNLDFLGPQRVTRASEILWDENDQVWAVWLVRQDSSLMRIDSLGTFTSYDSARKAEVAWLNACRRSGVAPDSEPASALALHARTALQWQSVDRA